MATKIPLFSKVHCKAYMTPSYDQVHMQAYNSDGTFFNPKVNRLDGSQKVIAYRGEKKIADLSEWCGETVHKTYRKREEKEFDGFLVGYTAIKCEGEIGTDMDYYGPDANEWYTFTKKVTYRLRVGVVYYRNNSKRYVLPEDMEQIVEKDDI